MIKNIDTNCYFGALGVCLLIATVIGLGFSSHTTKIVNPENSEAILKYVTDHSDFVIGVDFDTGDMRMLKDRLRAEAIGLFKEPVTYTKTINDFWFPLSSFGLLCVIVVIYFGLWWSNEYAPKMINNKSVIANAKANAIEIEANAKAKSYETLYKPDYDPKA